MQEKLMHPYIIEELSRIRRQEIDKEFEQIHLSRKIKAKQPKLGRRVFNSFLGFLIRIGNLGKKWLISSLQINFRHRRL